MPLALALRVDWDRAWTIWKYFLKFVKELMKRYPPPPPQREPASPAPPPPPPPTDDGFVRYIHTPLLIVTRDDILDISGGELRRNWDEVVEATSPKPTASPPQTTDCPPPPTGFPKNIREWTRLEVVAVVGTGAIVLVGAGFAIRWWRRKRRGLPGRRPNPGDGPGGDDAGGDGPGGPGGAGRWPRRTRGLLEALDDTDDDSDSDGGGGGGGGPPRLVLRRLVLLFTLEGLGMDLGEQDEHALPDEEDLGFEAAKLQQVVQGLLSAMNSSNADEPNFKISVCFEDLFVGTYGAGKFAVIIPSHSCLNPNECSLRGIDYPNMPHLIGQLRSLSRLFKMTGGKLIHNLDDSLDLPMLLKNALDICTRMDYLYPRGTFHRELKSLPDPDHVMKVSGLYHCRNGVMTVQTDLHTWMAPKVMNYQLYYKIADACTFGSSICLYVFTSGSSVTLEADHANIFRLIGSCPEPPQLCRITEYISRRSAFDFFPNVLYFTLDICQVVKVADFGQYFFQNQDDEMAAEIETCTWMVTEVPFNIINLPEAAIGVWQGLCPKFPESAHQRLTLMQINVRKQILPSFILRA